MSMRNAGGVDDMLVDPSYERQPKSLSLYDIEEDLTALLDTEDMVEDEETRLRILDDIVEKHEAAVAKRDNLIRFIRHTELQIEAVKAEQQRLAKLRKSWENGLKRVREYVAGVIEQLPEPKRGARKLEGTIGVLSIAKTPDTVEVEDASFLPWNMLDAVIYVRGEDLGKLQEALESMDSQYRPILGQVELKPRKAHIKAALEARQAAIARAHQEPIADAAYAAKQIPEEIPGADLKMGGYSLRIR